MSARPMTPAEHRRAQRQAHEVRRALTALRIARLDDEDVQVATARLENWLTEHAGRWVT